MRLILVKKMRIGEGSSTGKVTMAAAGVKACYMYPDAQQLQLARGTEARYCTV